MQIYSPRPPPHPFIMAYDLLCHLQDAGADTDAPHICTISAAISRFGLWDLLVLLFDWAGAPFSSKFALVRALCNIEYEGSTVDRFG
jgi:hypothetical protein